ncbi:hypothetical protein BAUCODRAFT_152365 [Baudoinia panamericana UAMH 10762]|uniref:Serine-threonine protein kinase 19 n=1 Tax=Baudoinia panamericana (strain UAMH 10762) TaxID=717646 RepID=M2M3G1_BAUPA|nr:uncharacterized protein BAUCODRAFT_152365 [Baudoinia panamericana UAMH 10762]EMC91066.1 hypothetical protein BAUCODRAFT_152365 [Baudoinia panamericana UAMH 10762]
MPKSISPFARRKSSPSPFSSLPRKKPGSRKSSLADKENATDRLDDVGGIPSLSPSGVRQGVISLARSALEDAWDDVPAVAGMNSERISDILRFRKAMPPIVSTAHLHALSVSSTETERELARLVAEGKVRRVVIPGRGKGGTAVGDGIALTEDWKSALDDSGLPPDLKQKYALLLDARPDSATTSTTSLSQTEIQQLVSAGFLTNPAALTSASNLFAPPGASSLIPLSQAGHTAPTGSIAAIGGQNAIHESGGGGSSLATQPTRNRLTPEMAFSLPSTGAYLKLLTEARQHLLNLLKQLSPRYKEATRDLLKEKWEGNVLGDAASRAKRARGEWSGVLPGKTKKWREFYGLRFEWVLAECVGSGLVELFDTGSVGVGVRAR